MSGWGLAYWVQMTEWTVRNDNIMFTFRPNFPDYFKAKINPLYYHYQHPSLGFQKFYGMGVFLQSTTCGVLETAGLVFRICIVLTWVTLMRATGVSSEGERRELPAVQELMTGKRYWVLPISKLGPYLRKPTEKSSFPEGQTRLYCFISY